MYILSFTSALQLSSSDYTTRALTFVSQATSCPSPSVGLVFFLLVFNLCIFFFFHTERTIKIFYFLQLGKKSIVITDGFIGFFLFVIGIACLLRGKYGIYMDMVKGTKIVHSSENPSRKYFSLLRLAMNVRLIALDLLNYLLSQNIKLIIQILLMTCAQCIQIYLSLCSTIYKAFLNVRKDKQKAPNPYINKSLMKTAHFCANWSIPTIGGVRTFYCVNFQRLILLIPLQPYSSRQSLHQETTV